MMIGVRYLWIRVTSIVMLMLAGVLAVGALAAPKPKDAPLWAVVAGLALLGAGGTWTALRMRR